MPYYPGLIKRRWRCFEQARSPHIIRGGTAAEDRSLILLQHTQASLFYNIFCQVVKDFFLPAASMVPVYQNAPASMTEAGAQ